MSSLGAASSFHAHRFFGIVDIDGSSLIEYDYTNFYEH